MVNNIQKASFQVLFFIKMFKLALFVLIILCKHKGADSIVNFQGGQNGLRQLQDDLLLETRKKAINLQLDKEFIRLLENEISKRNLKISKTS